MSPQKFLVAVLASIALVVLAGALLKDGSIQRPVADAAPQATSTPVVAAPSFPALDLARMPVRWVAVPDVLDLDGSRELDDPLAGLQQDTSIPWVLHVVGQDGLDREVYESHRWVRELRWQADGLSARLLSAKALPSTLAANLVAPWGLTLEVDSVSGQATAVSDPLPSACGDCTALARLARSGGAGVHVVPEATGDRVLVVVYYDNGLNALDRPPFLIDAAYIVEAGGATRRLEGVSGLWSLGWFPNGKALLARGGPLVGTYGDVYLIPAVDGDAIFLPASIGFGLESDGIDGATAGSRAAFVYRDESGPDGPDNYIGIFDSNTWQAYRLGISPPGAVLSSSQPPVVRVAWAEDDQLVTGSSEGDALVIDVRTGARRPASRADLYPPDYDPIVRGSRYDALIQQSPAGDVPGVDCSGLPQSLHITDKQTGQIRTLLQCPTGEAGRLSWLNATTLVAEIYNCSQCEPTSENVLLIDAVSGDHVSLTGGLEEGADALSSPRGDRVIVSGKSIRIFDQAGHILRDYGSLSPGAQIKAMLWSPDGSSFAYVTGPRDLFTRVSE